MDTLFENTLSKNDNLLKKFEQIHDYIYAHDGLSPQQTLEEFVKILFIKIYDENDKTNKFQITDLELNQLKIGQKSDSFVSRIQNLFDETKQEYTDLFESDEKIKLSKSSLGFIISQLQSISLLNSSQDAKGLAFQKFLSHGEKDRLGQFFTPEPVINFCVDFLKPQPHERIIDPACGSGGFLISALKYIQQNADNQNVKTDNFYGVDFNMSIVRIAKMKLILESNTNQNNVFFANSLEEIDKIKSLLNQKEGFDVVLANPPFGSKIADNQILKKYNLGYKWTKQEGKFYPSKTLQKQQNAEILFIERCLELLKNGGRMGIVLPNGNFENPSLEYLRQFIKTKAKILAVIHLPQETFIPYGTGVKTSLLFLEKNPEIKPHDIFFGRIQKLGYQGNKNGTPVYKKNKYGQLLKNDIGKHILEEDFTEILAQYSKHQHHEKLTSKNTYSISSNHLNGRFDYEFYAPENRKFIEGFTSKNAVRLGEICKIIKQKSTKLKDKELLVKYVELSDINADANEIINSTALKVHELPSRASYELKTNDIITAIAGNSVGSEKHATALVSEKHDGFICTNGFRVFRDLQIDRNYFLYFLKTEMFLRQMFMYRTGAAIPNVSESDLAKILIYLPVKEVQEEISEKMNQAIELRRKSKQMIQNIMLEVKK